MMNLDIDTILQHALGYALHLIIALSIFFIGRFVAKRVARLVEAVMRKSHIDETLVSFAGNILYGLGLAFVAIAALSQLGINTTSLAAAVAAAGLAVGLALQSSLSNLAAGVMIILFRPFKIGDYVEAAGIGGTVEGISIFTTQMKTPDNKTIIIPNGSIISNNIVNFSAKPTRRIDLTFSVGYGEDLKQVKDVMAKLVAADKRILKEPAPAIAVSELAAGSIHLVCRPWVASKNYWDVYFDLVENMKLAFDAENIAIPQAQTEIFVNLKNKASTQETEQPVPPAKAKKAKE